MDLILDKTDKGREEIATRKYHLTTRLRSFLLVIDGKHKTGDLLKKFQELGLNDQILAELLENGFIQGIGSPQAAASIAADSNPAAARQAPTIRNEPALQPIAAGSESQFQSVYHFYCETIKSAIGLRGYALQLKVERASSIEDFRLLRDPYLKAVLKTKGTEMERSLRDRLDQLLYSGEKPPSYRYSQ
ncbi:MAG: hypothetical protein JWQ21_1896 [Herminiimonas sp.]|nr:hypothetical protein [Herminiimonas sp.]